jgi:hypothetical protein
MNSSNTRAEVPPNPLEGWVPFDDYVRQRPQFFPAPGTRSYFLRFRKQELLERGIYVRTQGGEFCDPEQMDEYVLDLGRRGETYRSKVNPEKIIPLN